MLIDLRASLRPRQKPTSSLHFSGELFLPSAHHARLD
jgi:hypothetical protein